MALVLYCMVWRARQSSGSRGRENGVSLSRRRVVEVVVGWLVESEEACCEVSVRHWLASGTVSLRRAWEEGGREAFWSRWERIP